MTSQAFDSPRKSTNVRLSITSSWLARLAPRWVERRAARAFLTPRRHARQEADTLPPGRPVPLGGLSAWSWGKGPAVLLIHGWEDDHRSLAGFVAPLVARGFRAVALDLPGHGRSPGRISSIPMMARAVAELARAAAPAHGVIGHSLGGLAAALALPDLPASRAAFLAAPSEPHDFTRAFAARLGLGAARTAGVIAEIERMAGAPMADLNLPRLAARQRAAALFVHSRDDRMVPPEHGRRNAAAWPGAALRLVDGLGHRRLLRDPEVIGEVVAFIAAAPSAAASSERAPATPLDPFEELPSMRELRADAAHWLLDVWREWRARARDRRRLASLDERSLHDIGLPRVQADYEAAQPFWRPIRDRRS